MGFFTNIAQDCDFDQTEIVEILNKIKALETTIADLTTKVDELEASINATTETVETLNNTTVRFK